MTILVGAHGTRTRSIVRSLRIGMEANPRPDCRLVIFGDGTFQQGSSVTEDDKSAIGARIRLHPDPQTPYNRTRSRTVSTDQNGHFSLQIAPGKYQVVARSRGMSGGAVASSDPRTISVSEHDRKTIQLTIAPE